MAPGRGQPAKVEGPIDSGGRGCLGCRFHVDFTGQPKRRNFFCQAGTGLPDPTGNAWASGAKGFGNIYSPSVNASNVQMNPLALSITGGNLPHNNMMPYLGLTFIIALRNLPAAKLSL
ncbi:MAG: phage tail protein [Candidatus Angelobacter sp.]